ncbi:IS4 family transposase, partial [Vibrio alfacsensis]
LFLAKEIITPNYVAQKSLMKDQHALDMAESFTLPERRERSYPRAVKRRPSRYATRPSKRC